MKIIKTIILCINCKKDISNERGSLQCPFCHEYTIVDSILQVTERRNQNAE